MKSLATNLYLFYLQVTFYFNYKSFGDFLIYPDRMFTPGERNSVQYIFVSTMILSLHFLVVVGT